MRILIIGGTVFLGRALVDAALAGGHQVTLFNRGKDNPELYPQVEKLRGDRDGGLDVLKGRQWDAVIDTCGYFPRIVRQSAELLAPAVGRYVFISTISVYADQAKQDMLETDPVGTVADETVEQITGETYGPLKALCEQAVEQALPGRSLVIRPGLIVGPYDKSDRFTYWPARVARGGEVLAPGRPDRKVQVIDVRDLAEWTIRMTEAGKTGVFNATGPAGNLTMAEALAEAKAALGSDATFTWVPDQFLLEQKVGPWVEMPLWVPETDEAAAIMSCNIQRALAEGLSFRPLAETVRDTLAWDRSRPAGEARRAGLDPAKEKAVLGAWRAK